MKETSIKISGNCTFYKNFASDCPCGGNCVQFFGTRHHCGACAVTCPEIEANGILSALAVSGQVELQVVIQKKYQITNQEGQYRWAKGSVLLLIRTKTGAIISENQSVTD